MLYCNNTGILIFYARLPEFIKTFFLLFKFKHFLTFHYILCKETSVSTEIGKTNFRYAEKLYFSGILKCVKSNTTGKRRVILRQHKFSYEWNQKCDQIMYCTWSWSDNPHFDTLSTFLKPLKTLLFDLSCLLYEYLYFCRMGCK